MSVMILDSGNSIIKAKIARRERGEVAFPHALRPLTENEEALLTYLYELTKEERLAAVRRSRRAASGK